MNRGGIQDSSKALICVMRSNTNHPIRNLPSGLCRLCHHRPRFCDDNTSSIVAFQARDLNEIVRAPNRLTFSAPSPCPPWFKTWQELHLISFSLRPDTSWYWFDTDHLFHLPLTPSALDSEYKNDVPFIRRLPPHKQPKIYHAQKT